MWCTAVKACAVCSPGGVYQVLVHASWVGAVGAGCLCPVLSRTLWLVKHWVTCAVGKHVNVERCNQHQQDSSLLSQLARCQTGLLTHLGRNHQLPAQQLLHTGAHATRETTHQASSLPTRVACWQQLVPSKAGASKHALSSVYHCRHRPFCTASCTHLRKQPKRRNQTKKYTSNVQEWHISPPPRSCVAAKPTAVLLRPPQHHDGCCLTTWHAL